MPSYKLNDLRERYNEAFSKKTELPLEENDSVMEKLNITQIKSKRFCPSLLLLEKLLVNTNSIKFNFYFNCLGSCKSLLVSYIENI